jgi:hypothetical protein
MLPQIIANQRRREDLERQEELKNIQIGQFDRQHSLANKTRQAAERASEIGMGMEGVKLGSTMSTRFGGTTVGNVADSTRSLFGMKGGGVGTSPGGFLNQLSVGSFLGGGLAGYGAGRMLGKKKKKATRGLVGAGLGAALGLLGGGGMGGAITGGIGGGIGGLFG